MKGATLNRITESIREVVRRLPDWIYSFVVLSLLTAAAGLWWVARESSGVFQGERLFRLTTLLALMVLALMETPYFRKRVDILESLLGGVVAFVVVLVGLAGARSFDSAVVTLVAALPPGLAYLQAHRIRRITDREASAKAEVEAADRHAQLMDTLEKANQGLAAARLEPHIAAGPQRRLLYFLAASMSVVIISLAAKRKP
jgi:hypothetical protein